MKFVEGANYYFKLNGKLQNATIYFCEKCNKVCYVNSVNVVSIANAFERNIINAQAEKFNFEFGEPEELGYNSNTDQSVCSECDNRINKEYES